MIDIGFLLDVLLMLVAFGVSACKRFLRMFSNEYFLQGILSTMFQKNSSFFCNLIIFS
jgi:hypothetical protein